MAYTNRHSARTIGSCARFPQRRRVSSCEWMARSRKFSLPLITPASPAPREPIDLEAARKKLGGRGLTEALAGSVVEVDARGARCAHGVGVVLFAQGDAVDVWIDDGIVQRTTRGSVRPFGGIVPDKLAELATDAKEFATLSEGIRVRFATRDGSAVGGIVEKCRYGALVLRDDGKMFAIGFRKIKALSRSVLLPN